MKRIAMLILFGVGIAGAQEKTSPAKMTRTQRADLMQDAPVHTFYLKHASQPNDGNEILTGLRLILDPSIKLYLVPSQNAITMRALPDDLALATQIITELDREKPTFKLTYVLTEFDGGKKVSTERYVMALEDGQRGAMKQGVRVPIQQGKFDVGTNQIETQMSYIPVGMSFDATLSPVEGGAVMKSVVEKSEVVEGKTMATGPNPLIRQVAVDGVYRVMYGKALVLGSLEMPGTGHRVEVEALLEKGN